MFVKSELDGEKITLYFGGYNMYIKGFMLEKENCFQFDDDTKKFVPFEDMKAFAETFDIYVVSSGKKSNTIFVC